MSNQLAVSAAFSVFTMAAFALFASPDAGGGITAYETGATTHVAAPALDRAMPVLFDLTR